MVSRWGSRRICRPMSSITVQIRYVDYIIYGENKCKLLVYNEPEDYIGIHSIKLNIRTFYFGLSK
jgi:hypothetical protein